MDFAKSYEESGPETAIFFILSPGVDPLKDVEKIGHKLGFSVENGNFHNISLGQGQEVVAEYAIEVASQNGHWVVLQVSDEQRGTRLPRLWYPASMPRPECKALTLLTQQFLLQSNRKGHCQPLSYSFAL
jgi:Dynein heavy chain region D6 P-loop domain